MRAPQLICGTALALAMPVFCGAGAPVAAPGSPPAPAPAPSAPAAPRTLVLPSDLPPPIPTRGLKTDAQLTIFLDQLDANWGDLLHKERQCEAEPAPSDTCEAWRWGQALTEMLSTPEYVDAVWRLGKGVKDTALARRMRRALPALLTAVFDHDAYIHQATDPIADTVASFRPAVGGIIVTREQAREIMRRDEDRVRRRSAYESGEPLSQKIAPDLVELVRRRNNLAQRFGYDDYLDLKLSAEGLRPRQLEALEDSLDLQTQAPYAELLDRIRVRLKVFQLHPWDLAYGQELLDDPRDTTLKGDEAGVRLASFVAGMGLNPDALPIRVVFVPGAPFGTRCVPVDPPRDIRLLSNPTNGLGGYISVFHEYGRGLLEANLPDPRPSARACPEVWQETLGNFFGSLAGEESWLTGGLGLPDSTAHAYRSQWLGARLLSVRTLLMLSRFERELYRKPDQDVDALWRRLTEKYLDVEASDASLWASETPLLVQPFSSSRYLVAEAAAAQLLAAVRARFGRAEGGSLGPFLLDRVCRPTATLPWTAILERATGAPLEARALARELGAK